MPKPIGIIGGAGPLAGALLFEQVIQLSQKIYGCKDDYDFPKIILISYPFSDMLGDNINENQIRYELKKCIQNLREWGTEVIGIACNTLHAFLDEDDLSSDLIHLHQVLAENIKKTSLVLCTSTSRRFALHKRFISSIYPDLEIQNQLNVLIQQILIHGKQIRLAKELQSIVNHVEQETVILGCTELSLYADLISSTTKTIIDPLKILSNEIIKKSFK